MRIAIGADHVGYDLKAAVGKFLTQLDHEWVDFSPATLDPEDDYPVVASQLARAVAKGEFDRGVLICGTGIGMSIAANKVEGIRAALIGDEKTAALSRQHNDANIFCAGARITPVVKIAESLKVWLETPFEGGRHLNRVAKITAIEKNG